MALLALASAPALAASAADAGLPDLITPSVRESVGKILKAAPQWTAVSMRVDFQGAAFHSISEPALRINVNGVRGAGNSSQFFGTVGEDMLNILSHPVSGQDLALGFELFGSSVDVTLDGSGGAYFASGFVGERRVSFSLKRVNRGYFLWGQPGLNLTVDAYGPNLMVSGQFDPARADERLLAVVGMALAVANAR